jgi:beta-lactamase regulating signal transducer with metallopeptidase domain
VWLTVVFLWSTVGLAGQLATLWRGWRRTRGLLAVGREVRHGVTEIETEAPIAFAMGIMRPRIYVSSKLRRSLNADLLAAITVHEEAHVRRRDGLRKLVAAVLSLGHLPWIRRQLLADLALSCEQACDAAAARFGDRLRVAEAILAVERMWVSGPREAPLAISAFGGANVAARVEALLAEPPAMRQTSGWWWGVALVTAVVVVAAPLHHATETLLNLLLG